MDLNRPHLSDLLRQQHKLLDEIFGRGSYQIEEIRPAVCELKTAEVEIEFAFDPRDRWVSSMIKPLNVPADLVESYPAGTFLRFCDIDEPVRRKSNLNGDQIVAELELIEPAIRLLRDPQKCREAVWFARGYCAAYTDWARGRFG